MSDKNNPRLDYGNVMFDRRNRFLATFLYQLPFGKGQNVPAQQQSPGRYVDRRLAVGRRDGLPERARFSPFRKQSVDSANTGILNTAGAERADVVPGVSPKATAGLTNSAGPVFINPAAFTFPPVNAGRFGDSSVGNVVGPGTDCGFSFADQVDQDLRNGYSFNLARKRPMRSTIGTSTCRIRFWMISRLVRFRGCRARKGQGRGMWRSRGGSASRG